MIPHKLIIGLGNPDKKYANTYHNVGQLFIYYLSKNVLNPKFSILNSNTYMNESGNFVLMTLKKTNTEPDELLIVHDDSDLALGQHKISFGRGAAGHHGVESIIETLKTNDFWRLRIGIRPQNEKNRQKAEKFVLKKISAADKKILEQVFQTAVKELN